MKHCLTSVLLAIGVICNDACLCIDEAKGSSVLWLYHTLVKQTTALVCVVTWCLSLVYVRTNWLYLLDIVDYSINSYMIPLLAISQSIVLLIYRRSISKFLYGLSSNWWKGIIPRLPVAWGVIILFLLYALISNIVWGVLSYGDYPELYLWIWIGIVLIILVVSVFLGQRISYEENNSSS